MKATQTKTLNSNTHLCVCVYLIDFYAALLRVNFILIFLYQNISFNFFNLITYIIRYTVFVFVQNIKLSLYPVYPVPGASRGQHNFNLKSMAVR